MRRLMVIPAFTMSTHDGCLYRPMIQPSPTRTRTKTGEHPQTARDIQGRAGADQDRHEAAAAKTEQEDKEEKHEVQFNFM